MNQQNDVKNEVIEKDQDVLTDEEITTVVGGLSNLAESKNANDSGHI